MPWQPTLFLGFVFCARPHLESVLFRHQNKTKSNFDTWSFLMCFILVNFSLFKLKKFALRVARRRASQRRAVFRSQQRRRRASPARTVAGIGRRATDATGAAAAATANTRARQKSTHSVHVNKQINKNKKVCCKARVAADVVSRARRLLHEYNEAKDIAQSLFGQLAALEGVTTKKVYERFDVALED